MNPKRGQEISPATIMHNVYAVYPSLAMVAGMELDLFTLLKDGPLAAETLASRLQVLCPSRKIPK